MTQWIRPDDLMAVRRAAAAAPPRPQVLTLIAPDRPNAEQEFWRLFRQGWSHRSLAKRFGITPGRAREVIEKKAVFPR